MNITQVFDICTGCGCCAAICPSSAIQMQSDSHGFPYPTIDAKKCTDCSLCVRKCPVSVPPQASIDNDILTGYAKDEALLSASSSGAIFPVLAAEIIQRGGIVFGAAFNREFDVIHTAAQNIPALSALFSSKYVQSSISANCFSQVKEALAADRWVYFSGTPCQIAGLKNYLGREYETLITQDTACHSVPSPMIFKDYCASLETKADSKLTAFSFRNKSTGWENYQISASFADGSTFSQSAAENPYQRGFIRGLYSRDSCFACKFKGISRCSDITLADYWGVKGIQPEAYHPSGTSLIVLHSEKGRALLKCLQNRMEIRPAAEGAFTWNSAMQTSIQKPPRYNEFWSEYGTKPFEALVSSCCAQTKKEATNARWNRSILARCIRCLTR